MVSSESRKLLYIVARAGRATRALVRRLVLPSCTAPPLAARALFTRSPANQRGRSGAWTRCAPGGENGCCAAPRLREEGAEGLRSGFPPAQRKRGLTDPKIYRGLVAVGGRVQMLLEWEWGLRQKENVLMWEFRA